MKLHHCISRLLALNAIQRQLYPPPSIDFCIRRYEETDRPAVLKLYGLNAPDRFPVGHRPVFERFVDSHPVSFFVADSPAAGLIACGGVLSVGERVHTLCYGLVAPSHQRRGIGSTMTLARLVFATRALGPNFSFIFSVPKSMGFYRRFGFSQQQSWKGDDQKDYPVGVLGYSNVVLIPVEVVLRKRGFLIDPSLPITPDETQVAVITKADRGKHRIEFKKTEPNKSPEPTPTAEVLVV